MEIIIGLIIFILDVIAIFSVISSNLETATKLIWILVIILLPVIGMILWFLIGKRSSAATA